MARIAIDFDGVLSTYENGYTTEGPLDPPVEGAKEFVWWLVNHKYEVFIFTARCDMHTHGPTIVLREQLRIREWLRLHGFPEIETITGWKIHADFYIDDRGFRFEGEFGPVLQFIKHGLKPWNKKDKKDADL